MSITITLPDGKEKTVPFNVFNQKNFLRALKYDCAKLRREFLENHKEELTGLSTEDLKQKYKQLGSVAEEVYKGLFIEYDTPIKTLAHYFSSGRIESSEVDLFKEIYRGWSLLDTKTDMVKSLLRKRIGKGNFRRDTELSKAYEINRELGKRLDRAVLWFGYS
jgi:ribosome biogenesis GTPase A